MVATVILNLFQDAKTYSIFKKNCHGGHRAPKNAKAFFGWFWSAIGPMKL